MLCGGYYLIKPAPRGEWMSVELLPEMMLSISECICDSVSTNWAVEWVNQPREVRATAARKLGVEGDSFERASKWATEALESGEFGVPNVFPTLHAARRFRAEFVPDTTGLKMVGIGLPEDYVDAFLEESAPSEGQFESGMYLAMKLRKALEPGGRMLGFEVLGLDYHNFHSSTCNSLETEFADQLGIKPNADGFIAEQADARRCAEFAGLETTGAEPGLWLPWQVLLYD